MTWKVTFDKGVACFKRGNLDEALTHMNQAAELESNAFIIYDSRAAVHERLGNLKAAFLDSKRVIDLAPDRWQGYARSARLFDLVGKYESAVTMVDLALARLRPEDVQRRTQLAELREKAVTAQAAAEAQRLSQDTWTSYLLGKLPVETLVEIFTVLIDQDHTWAIRLSHVCGHWRRILVSTPSAWQTLVLRQKHPSRKAKLWKERAKNRISHISLSISQLDRGAVFAQLKDLSWDHLSSLCIYSEAFVELHRFLSDISLPHVFSKIEELKLLGFNSPENLSCCLSGPDWKLRTLHLNGSVSMKDEWWERIRQLKELYVLGSVGPFSTRVFAANPSLEKLVLDCPQLNSNLDRDADLVSMDNLKHVECRHISNPLAVLRVITAPSITYFGMFAVAFLADETLLHMACYPSLVKLHITNCGLNPSTLPRLLSSTPNLETLQINAVSAVVNEVFQFLTAEVVDSLPCRALRHVDVSSCADLTTSSLYAFVKARTQYSSDSVEPEEKCAAIASLRVDACPNIESDMLPWFRSKVARFSCAYATKKDFRKNRQR